MRIVGYYVQQLHAQNKETNVLPLTMNGRSVTGVEERNGFFANAVYDKGKNKPIVEIVNTSNGTQPVSLAFEDLKKQDALPEGHCITLDPFDQDKDNTFE